jgi:GT2 family glycosyltransferase
MSKEQIPKILVICASRLPEESFLKTQTGRSLLAFHRISPVEVRLFPNNTQGLGAIYNRAIEEVGKQNTLLVFMHDDVLISDYFWGETVRNGLEEFDIVGIVGNTRRIPMQPGWILVDSRGRLDEYQYLSGSIGQGEKFPPERLDVFGPAGRNCKLMDGVFLATYSETLQQSRLRFDEQFKFHFYDVDFCRQAEQMGLNMGTIPLSIVHASAGAIDEDWKSTYEFYIKKWND